MFLLNWLTPTNSQLPETKNKSSSAAKTGNVADETVEKRSLSPPTPEAKKLGEWRKLRRKASITKSEDEVSIREKATVVKKRRSKPKQQLGRIESPGSKKKLKAKTSRVRNAATTIDPAKRCPSAEAISSDTGSQESIEIRGSPSPEKLLTSAEALVDGTKKLRLADEITIREKRAKRRGEKSPEKMPEVKHDIADYQLKKAFAKAAEESNVGTEDITIAKAKPPYTKIEFELTAEIFGFAPSKQQTHKRVFRYHPDPWRRYASRKKIHEMGGFILPENNNANDRTLNFSYVTKGSKPPPQPGAAPIMSEADQLQRMPTTNSKAKGKSKRKRAKESMDD